MNRFFLVRFLVPLLAVASVCHRTTKICADAKPSADDEMVRVGQELFKHEWTPGDRFAGRGDGLGPVYNAKSCAACHKQARIGGAGPLENNVKMGCVRDLKTGETRISVIHAFATREDFRETLSHVAPGLPPLGALELRELSRGSANSHGSLGPKIGSLAGVTISDYSTTALFGSGLIDAVPDGLILANERNQRLHWRRADAKHETGPVGRAPRLGGGRLGKFGRKAQISSLSNFVRSACANELGLGSSSHAQATSLAKRDYRPPGLDLTDQQCDQITAFVASLPRPIERAPQSPTTRARAASGKTLFHSIGCADCHAVNLGSIEGLYSDLLLHRMGRELGGDGFYFDSTTGPLVVTGDTPQDDEWRTPPLWGVADSAPYLHDGRAATLSEAIRLHDGQGTKSSQQFARLADSQKADLLIFLNTLRAP
jgi:CxxC motif-containing protein (DUF1111 family)